MSTKTERVEARLSPEERQLIRRAADLAGQSISSFVVAAAVAKADEFISDHLATRVPPDYFDRLVDAMDQAGPAPKLHGAAIRVRKRRRIR